MTREEAKTAMSNLIDVFRKEYPNGGAFAAIQATGGHSLINKIYNAHEAKLKAKDERIANLSAERDKYNTIAANLQISRQKAYDNIAELEAIIEKMKSCENCESHTNVGSNCLLDMEDSLGCRANNYSNWKLKDNE